MTDLSRMPTQIFTFLFTDIEGSTRLWELYPQAMKTALERHDAVLREAVEHSKGEVVKTTGDGLMAVFSSALDGVHACLKAQLGLRNEPWGETGPLQVRMGLHVGEVQPRDGDYYGKSVNRAARLMSAAHGGQILLSSVAAGLVIDMLPEGTSLRDLGQHRLKDLTRPEHVFQLLHPGLPADFPPLASLDRHQNNLPAQPTALIGREKELGEIVASLQAGDVRLLTLTGPGGIGKTRLALQAGAELIDRFADGVYFIDLAPIREPQRVLTEIAHTLGLKEASDGSLLDELTTRLQSRQMLLILDNFEQVTEAAAIVAELLRNCPGLTILVTSREALHVRGEHVVPVPPLRLPKVDLKKPTIEQISQYEAVRLFIERAQAVKPDFKVTNENAPAVAEICVRLDGLPLAIELAAARIRLFSPQALLDRLGNRLKLLQSGARDLPIRQQTLRDAIGWSYEMLSPAEQRLFEILSVFSGGSSYEAVEGIISGPGVRASLDELLGEPLGELGVDAMDGLASLVEKSLIRQEDLESGDSRLVMLETIREYAAERLVANPEFEAAARQAHAVYYSSFTQTQIERLANSGRYSAPDDLEAEVENVQTAWRYWIAEKDPEQLGKIVDGLWLLYELRGWYQAMIDLTNDLLSVLASIPSTKERIQEEVTLQTSLARALLAVKGYTAEVEQAYTRALELSRSVGEFPQMFPVLRGMASYYLFLGMVENAAQMGEKILNLAERLDDENMRVEGYLVLGYSRAFLGDVSQGLALLEKAGASYDPERFRRRSFSLGSSPGVVRLAVSALFLIVQGFPERALEQADNAIRLATRLNHPYSLAYALFHTSLLHLWRREAELAQARAQSVLEIAREHEYLVWEAVATCTYGAALAQMGKPDQGVVQILEGIRRYRILRTPPVFWTMLLYLLAEAYGQLGQPQPGLETLHEVTVIVGADSEDIFAPEFYRLRGDLLLALSPDHAPEANQWFERALQVARKRKVPMFELRAAIRIYRLWRQNSAAADAAKAEQVRQLLSSVYQKFSEGFSTADLVEARELLMS